MKKVIKNNYKIIIGFIIGLIFSITTVYAVEAYIESNKVSYDNQKITTKENVQEAIDELYEKSGIHNEKWTDPILNGADPVLKDPLIPVTIDNNGNVYYANLNSEWYNYSEKRWANAIILTDTAKGYKDDKEYKVGMQIKEDDIESYFVWIPRYQYKIWNMGQYTSVIDASTLNGTMAGGNTDLAVWSIVGSNARIIDIKFGNINTIPKMAESEATIDNYYTHPAFTLGDKNLNGIWVGKFETGGSASNVVVKPNVVSWRNETVKVFFDAAKGLASTLDSHMMKNTEWGAVAYLSHSAYGIGNKVNINNNSDYKTGYSSYNAIQEKYYGSYGDSDLNTLPWNTSAGHLASTTGNISGVYDMSGGAYEYVAACIEETPGSKSGFDETTLSKEMTSGYIDKYAKNSTVTKYNNRILGDATGEMGPFYNYYEVQGGVRSHESWYSTDAHFITTDSSWFIRGGAYEYGKIASQFNFGKYYGTVNIDIGFRISLTPII